MLALLVALLAVPGTAHAGAWVPEPAHGYAELMAVVFPGATRAFGDTELLVQLGAYGYGEVGVAAGRLALLARVPLYVHTFLPARDMDRGGFGDLGLGARVGLVRGAWPVAVEGWASFPTGLGDGVLPTGFGAWGAAGALFVGHSFEKGWWGQAGAGGEWAQGYGAALRVEVASGRQLSEHWSIDGTLIFRIGFGPAPSETERVQYRGDERWGTLNVRARYAITPVLGLYVGLDVGLFSVNAPIGVPVPIGLSAKW